MRALVRDVPVQSAVVSQLRLDPLTGRWIAVVLERAERPHDFAPRSLPVEGDPERSCPFCPGHEEVPSFESLSPNGDWRVRVVPNRYPAFSGDEPMAVEHRGPVFMQAPASGIHEVLVLGPEHGASWADLPDDHAEQVMTAIRDRIAAHAHVGGLRYSQAIVNSGREAGASLEHPHAQLLGIPFVPREIADELAGFARFSGSCLLCTTWEAEVVAGHRVVLDDGDIVVLCPFWSGTPFELLVVPKDHDPHLHAANDALLAAAGRAIRDALHRLRSVVGDVAYNLVFHSAPYRVHDDYHWHVHALPKLTTRAGFELGTGVLINIIPPEIAARDLRAAS